MSQGGGVGRLCCFLYFIIPIILKTNIFILTISTKAIASATINETLFVPDAVSNTKHISKYLPSTKVYF